MIKKLITGTLDCGRAIYEGDFFPESLQNQGVMLEALQELIKRTEALDKRTEALEKGLQLANQKIDRITSSPLIYASLYVESEQNVVETMALEFLLPRLANKTVVDVGAHRGRFTDMMLEIGCSHVVACEPHPELATFLQAQHAASGMVTVLPCAVSSQNGSAKLHLVQVLPEAQMTVDPLLFSTLTPHNMPTGMVFEGEVEVEVRSLRSLVEEGTIPRRAGILKVDAEGHDLAVFHGMPEDCPYDIVMSEFWSPDFVFSTPGIPDEAEVRNYLRGKGYPYTLSLARLSDKSLRFFANRKPELPNTWGNTLYFHDAPLFDCAYHFIRNILPQAI